MSNRKRTKDSTEVPIDIARQVKKESYGKKKSSLFGENVLSRRLELNMTQEDLANAIGASRPRISDIENGRFPEDPERIIALADALDVSLDILFGRVKDD